MFKAIIGRLLGGRRLPRQLSYEAARDVLESQAADLKRELAGRSDAEPEMLYYLAGDEAPEVRRRIAANPATPHQANRLLADDGDDDVRAELARKIARLVPGMELGEAARARDLALEVLERLAADHLPRVRQIVAEEICRSERVPAALVRRLAADVETIVAAPVLEFSPLLSDEDLLEIIAGGAVSGVLAAIASRRNVNAPVADAVVATLDVPAVAALLANPSAQIREDALDRVISHAEEIVAWQKPLVLRPELSLRAVRRVAGFVAFSLLEILARRTDLDEATAGELRQRVRERIKVEKLSPEAADTVDAARRKVADARRAGTLGDDFVCDAILENARDVVLEALAQLSRTPAFAVERVFASRSAKAVTALCWRAGLQMRTAMRLQSQLLKLPARDLLMARHGVNYPMTPEEMAWHLSYFGVGD